MERSRRWTTSACTGAGRLGRVSSIREKLFAPGMVGRGTQKLAKPPMHLLQSWPYIHSKWRTERCGSRYKKKTHHDALLVNSKSLAARFLAQFHTNRAMAASREYYSSS